MFLKLTFAIVIFLMAYLAGLWAIYRRQSDYRHTIAFEALAAGIFLGAALFHMLPDAIHQFFHMTKSHIPWAVIICLLSILFMIMLSKTIYIVKHALSQQLLSGLVVASMLGIHSLLEGMTLGFAQQLDVILIVFIAILFHKAAASFALSIHLLRNHYTKTQSHRMILIFSLLTPLGIFSGSISQCIVSLITSQWLDAIFLAIAAGTFLYIALFEYVIPWLTLAVNVKQRLFLCISGVSLMGLLALWV